MDSLTQIVLGAAVGEAVLGKEKGSMVPGNLIFIVSHGRDAL